MPPRSRPLVFLFFLSGASGLAFEVLWTRIFTSILGSSTQSVGAVVTAFMLGIGLGQKIFGRLADEPRNLLRLYAALELGVAVLSLGAFWLFLGLEGVYRAAHLALPPALVKWGVFAVAFLVISFPAALIGGSLPVLVKQVLSSGAEAREGLGRLYGVNTVGAAIGAFGAVVVVSAAGYDVGYHLAVAASFLTATLALVLSRQTIISPAPPQAVQAERSQGTVDPAPARPAMIPVPPMLLVTAFAVSGFAALMYEVIWQRLLEFFLQGTLVSFALILGVWLLGAGLGSLLTRKAEATVAQFAVLEAAIAALGLGGLPLVTRVAEQSSRGVTIAVFLALVFVVTFLFGAIFPLAGRLYVASRPQVGKALGEITSANTLGSVLGSVSASFVLIPLVGTRGSLLVAGVANLAVAGALLLFVIKASGRQGSWRSAVGCAVAVVSLCVWLSSDWLGRYYLAAIHRPGFHLVAEKEGSLQSVLVLEDDEGQRVLMGGAFQSGEVDVVRRQTQRLQAHLPMLLHPAPRRVLEIGYGVGEIPRTVLLYQPERLDLVEIDANMIGVANEWFGALNQRVSDAKQVRTHLLDGRQFLRTTENQYDVIMTDSMIPISESSLRLYSQEHFAAGRAHLAPGGMMVMWLPLNVGAERVKVMLKTFLGVFPGSLLWLPQAWAGDEAFVVGFLGEPAIDVALSAERFARVAAPDLKPFGWSSAAMYFASFRLGPRELAELMREVKVVHRDRAPVLDFIPVSDGRGQEALTARFFAASRPVVNDFLPPGAPMREEIALVFQADTAFHDAQTREELEAVLAILPEHPAARLALGALVRDAASPPEREARAEAALLLTPWDVESNLVLMGAAQAKGDLGQAVEYARHALVMQPYSKRALAMISAVKATP